MNQFPASAESRLPPADWHAEGRPVLSDINVIDEGSAAGSGHGLNRWQWQAAIRAGDASSGTASFC